MSDMNALVEAHARAAVETRRTHDAMQELPEGPALLDAFRAHVAAKNAEQRAARALLRAEEET